MKGQLAESLRNQLAGEFAELRNEMAVLQGQLEAQRSRDTSHQETENEATTPRKVRPGGPPSWSLDSRIISGFPEIFAQFRGRRFSLLWRGTRDGFGADEFHDRCDGHPNTLTAILDTDGNIFGGFTPLEWEGGGWHSPWDESLMSFLFTLKNPHGIPARRFPLQEEEKSRAIVCNSEWGPDFWNIYVADQCNDNMDSGSYLGSSYVNDTGVDGNTFFTGAKHFQVKEIEVIEVLDPPPQVDSQIISDFPEIFAEFRKFSLLWRGSRDGFGSKDFHEKCDGHTNTLLVILDTNGNIFGGFTPVEWDSDSYNKADESLKSFVFTLKNPHNIPEKRFPLKAQMKQKAICCVSESGPSFVDICVADKCNENMNSYTSNFGNGYANDTGLDGKSFFTGSRDFQVKEIEVFEITE
jgi:hypothetical protein